MAMMRWVLTFLTCVVLVCAANAQTPSSSGIGGGGVQSTIPLPKSCSFLGTDNRGLPECVSGGGGAGGTLGYIYAADAPYNAKCDKVTDDTAAIQAALDAANATQPHNLADNFGNTGGYAVQLPPGICLVTGLTAHPDQRIMGSGVDRTILQLATGANKNLITAESAAPCTNNNVYDPVTCPYPDGVRTLVAFRISDMSMDGNRGGQVTVVPGTYTGNCIYLANNNTATNLNLQTELLNPGGTAGVYEGSIWARDLNIYNCAQDGIHGGFFRANGYLDRVWIAYTNWYGATINGYDWFITNGSFGKAGQGCPAGGGQLPLDPLCAINANSDTTGLTTNNGSGLYIKSFGCLQSVNTSYFANAGPGLVINHAAGCYTSIMSGSIDDNRAGGIYTDSRTSFFISHFNFTNNSIGGAGVYAQITLGPENGQGVTQAGIGAGQISIDNSHFFGPTITANVPSNPSYLIYTYAQQSAPFIHWGSGNSILGDYNLANDVTRTPAIGGAYTISQFGRLNGTDPFPLNMDFNSPYYYENRVINGAFNVDQRNAGTSVNIPNGRVYTLDHWSVQGSAAGILTAQQDTSDPPPGFNSDITFTVAATRTVGVGDYWLLQQIIESDFTSDLRWGDTNGGAGSVGGAWVVFSFWAKAHITGTYSAVLLSAFGSTPCFVIPYTVTAADTWQYFQFVVYPPGFGDFNNPTGGSIKVWFDLGSGSNNQILSSVQRQWGNTGGAKAAVSGSVQLVAQAPGTTLKIGGVRLRRGNIDIPYIPRPFQQELLLSQRYYQSSFPYGVQNTYNTGPAGCEPAIIGAANVADGVAPPATDSINQQLSWNVRYAQLMMKTPTVTTYNPGAASSASAYDVQATAAAGANRPVSLSVDPSGTASNKGFQAVTVTLSLPTSINSAKQGDTVCFHWSAQAEF